MKKLRFLATFGLLLTFALGATACGGGHTEDGKPAESDAASDETESGAAQEASDGKTYDPALDDSTVDLSATHVVNPSQWVGTDDLGRALPTNSEVGDPDEEKTVALFYWTWHGDFYKSQKAYNVQQTLDSFDDPDEAEEYLWLSSTSNANGYHFWNEPIWGYYSGNDEWVVRKQAEMLAAAGVDVVFFDNTNGAYTWLETALIVFEVFSEAKAQGVDVPQISFMLPFAATSAANDQVVELYHAIYEKGLYEDLWYKIDGKPMLMGYGAAVTDVSIRKFFTFRQNVAGYNDTQSQIGSSQWGWLSAFPQALYYTNSRKVAQTTVGVAVNYSYATRSIAPMNHDKITGRTYTMHGIDERPDAVLYGAHFQEQWDNALLADPQTIFVTGWNEWVAMKLYEWPGTRFTKAFVDQYSDAYSRDCEPTTGALKDNYYYQLVSNIRKFKGVEAVPAASAAKQIDLNGGFGQWADVSPTYNDYYGMTNRDCDGYIDPATNQALHYTNDTARNDVYDAKVARDDDYVYFMVRTVEELSPYTDEYWMRLYIDTTAEGTENWEEYEYIVNRTSPVSESQTVLERFTGNGFETEKVCDIEYCVRGNVLTVKIPKSALGITGDDFTLDFKWTDNTQEDGDIMKWYVNGDVAPIGRFNFRYTTTDSEPYTEEAATVETDFTNADEIAERRSYREITTKKASMETGEDGTVLTATGENASLSFNYNTYSPRPTAERFRYLAITYRASGDDRSISLTTSAQRVGQSLQKATRYYTLSGTDEASTVYIDLYHSVSWSYNYANSIVFGFGDDAPLTLMHFDLLEELPEGAQTLSEE